MSPGWRPCESGKVLVIIKAIACLDSYLEVPISSLPIPDLLLMQLPQLNYAHRHDLFPEAHRILLKLQRLVHPSYWGELHKLRFQVLQPLIQL